MIHDKIEFYHSKGKLFLGIIFSLLFVAMGTFLIYVAYIESILIFFLILFTIVMVLNMLVGIVIVIGVVFDIAIMFIV